MGRYLTAYLTAGAVESELWEIWQFIAKDNPEAATRVVIAAEQTFQLLADNPGLGRPHRFRRKKHRSVRFRSVTGFRNYLIFYHENSGGIEVLHVCHSARDIEAPLRKSR